MVSRTSSSSLRHRPSCTLSTKIFFIFYFLCCYFIFIYFICFALSPKLMNSCRGAQSRTLLADIQLCSPELGNSRTLAPHPQPMNQTARNRTNCAECDSEQQTERDPVEFVCYFPTADCCPLSANGSHCSQALETDAVAGELLKYKRSKKIITRRCPLK